MFYFVIRISTKYILVFTRLIIIIRIISIIENNINIISYLW